MDIRHRKPKKISKNKKAPAIHFPENNEYYEEAKQYTEKHFAKNYGTLTDEQLYPATFKEAEKWLEQFLETRFLSLEFMKTVW
jgi:deoxyribodipyrimidine photolyase-related protein